MNAIVGQLDLARERKVVMLLVCCNPHCVLFIHFMMEQDRTASILAVS